LRVAGLLLVALLLGAGPAVAGPIRGAYFFFYMAPEHLDRLAAHGFNTGLIHYFQESLDGVAVADMASKRTRADSLGLDLFVSLNFVNSRLLATSSTIDRRFRDYRGVIHPDVPCPADTAYWRGLFTEFLAPAARATARPARIALDLELYGTDITHYPAGPCTCLPCRLQYSGYTGPNRGLAEPWIEQLPPGDFEDLDRAEREWLTAFLVERLREIDQERGPLALSILDLGRPGLPNRALIAALERLDLPVFDFTEATYARGSEISSDLLTAPYAGRPLRVQIVDGLWLKKWSPAGLEEQALQLGRREQGYWIFTSFSLHAPLQELTGDFLLPAPQEDYWQALARANQRLTSGN